MGIMDQNISNGFIAVANVVKTKISLSEKGQPLGVATLDNSGKIPVVQLPSYVSDIVEYASVASFPLTGSPNIIYVDAVSNSQYRWSGTTYTKSTDGAVDSVNGHTGAVTLNKSDIGLDQVSNISAMDMPVSTLQQTAIDLKVDKVAGKGLSTEDYTTAEKTKLSGITPGAQVNQNAFNTILVAGQSDVVADSENDSLTLVAGTNVTITTNATGDSITINSTSNGVTNISTTANSTSVSVNSDTGNDGTINAATTTTAGVMTASDKTKLDGIQAGAQVNTITSVAGRTGNITLSKSDIAGINLIDNTSDLSKPVSTATQEALNAKADASALTALTNAIGSTTTNYAAIFTATYNA